MPLIDPNTLPYRPCVGIMLLNAEGLIWIGRRFEDLVSQEYEKRWQMPQGGIDKGEDPKVAAVRELHEETGVTSASIIAESKRWIQYDLPPETVGKAMKGKFRGQEQKWFAMRFTGDEAKSISIRKATSPNLTPGAGPPQAKCWTKSSVSSATLTVRSLKNFALCLSLRQLC